MAMGTLPKLDIAEGVVLLAVAPVLVLPTAYPVLTTVGLAALSAVWCARLVRHDLLPETSLNGALLVWMVTVVVGYGVTAFPDLALPKATGILLGIAVWSLVLRLRDRGVGAQMLSLGLALVGLVSAGLGVLATDWPAKVPVLESLLMYLPSILVRVPGAPEAGVHANELGGAVTPFVPLGVSLLLATTMHHTGSARLASWTSGSLIAVGLVSLGLAVFSQSRSAWLGVVGGTGAVVALWSWLAPSRRVAWLLRAVLAVGFLVGMGVALWLGPVRLLRLVEEPGQLEALGGVSTLGFRVEVWRWALVAISDFPFTGCGLGSFREVGRLLYPMAIAPNYDYAHAHNIFLQVALDTGIPGLIAYLALLATSAAVLWRAARWQAVLRPLAIGLIGGLVALHIYGLTDALAPGAKPGLVFWYMLGLIGAIGGQPDSWRKENLPYERGSTRSGD